MGSLVASSSHGCFLFLFCFGCWWRLYDYAGVIFKWFLLHFSDVGREQNPLWTICQEAFHYTSVLRWVKESLCSQRQQIKIGIHVILRSTLCWHMLSAESSLFLLGNILHRSFFCSLVVRLHGAYCTWVSNQSHRLAVNVCFREVQIKDWNQNRRKALLDWNKGAKVHIVLLQQRLPSAPAGIQEQAFHTGDHPASCIEKYTVFERESSI